MLVFVLVVAAVLALAQARLSKGERMKPPKNGLIYYIK
jgi:hypothetical protein